MKRIVSLLLILCLALALPVTAQAEADQRRAVIGADLNDEQIAQVYRAFGIERGTVTELTLTNAEERAWLEGYVDDSVLGTRAISCVYVELLPPGSGVHVTTSNVTWYTGEMYINALATAGVTDAEIIVAAPFEVSGTAALSGVFKAYEDITGNPVDNLAQLLSSRELSVTGELAQEIGGRDSASIISELKLMLAQTREMSDGELRALILEIAARYNVSLTETQIKQLIDLCRALEQLDPDQLRRRVEDVQSTLQRVEETGERVVGFVQTLRDMIVSVSDFFNRLRALFDR